MAHVEKQPGSNGKLLGGVTGKGFMPGKSGNANGRPRGRTLLEAIKAKLAENGYFDQAAVANAYVSAMKTGSFQHAKEVIEREEGKVPEDGTIRVVIEYTDANDTAEDETAARRAAACN